MQLKLSKTSISDFIAYLFSVRNGLHLHHLKQKGNGAYAAHIALNDAYEEILDFIDELAETAQTETLLEINIPTTSINGEALSYVKSVLSYVRNNRSIFPHSFQQNILDEIEALLSKTIYKLTFLK